MGNKLETKRKKFIAASVATAVVASAIAASASTAPAAAEGKSFTDVTPNFFAYEEIMGLSKAGIISGYADGSFRPYQTITRGQTAIMLAKALDLPAAPKAKPFTDISQNSPYYNAVSAVVQAGIIRGYGDDFRPNATLTREEMATIMVRAFHLTEKSQVDVPFKDLNSVSPTHRKNVEILFQNGLTKGKDANTYAPKESVTRVQFSMFLYRQLKDSLKEQQPPVVVKPPVDNGGIVIKPTETIDTNIFEGGKAYPTNYVITQSDVKVFGPELPGNNAIVFGTVTVKGNLELKNLTINGTLILDPGDQGEVTLTNVDASKIEVLSGETGTIKFSGVNSPQVIVKDQNGVKLETDGSSTLGNLELAPGNGSEVQLAGNFNDTNILITKETTLTAKNNFMASSLEINVANPNAEVKLNADTPTDLPAITVSSGVKLKSLSENISTPLINVNVQQPNQTVELNGPLGKPEVIVDKPITLLVQTPLSKVTANANLSLAGSQAANIASFEAGQNAAITSTDESTQKALDAKKAESITLAKTKITALKSEANPSLQGIQEADTLVKTAMSLGAVKADFQSGDVNLYDVLEGMKTSAAEKLAAISSLEKKLSALPKPEKLDSYTTFSITRLETAIKAAKAAEQAAIAEGVDPATVSNYERLAAAEARVLELKTEFQQVKSAAITALQALPEASSVKAENLDDAKKALAEATAAVAAAKLKGVKDADFIVNNVNLLSKLAEISNTIKKVEADYEAAKKAAIENAISKVALIPAKDHITVQTLGTVRPTVAAARTAVEAALKIGAAEKDITNLSLLTDAEAKITALDEARNTAITAANAAIAQLPSADSITNATLQDAKTKLETAEHAVADAKAKGAADTDFTGLEKITAVKEKIASLETAKQTAINEAVAALNQIPTAADITTANFKSVKEKIVDAKAKVEKAKELGATDAELTGIEKIAAAEAKIAELEKALTEAITAANTAIAALPDAATITVANIDDAKAKLQAAETAVADAKAKGASDSDLTGLEKITAVKDRITSLEKGKQAAIQDAVAALSQVPAADAITVINFKSVKEKVIFAKEKVSVAKELGAKDSELTGLEKLAPAEAKITSLEEALSAAITTANQKLSEIPAANEITLENIAEVQAEIDAAKAAVEAARQSGATDADFTDLNKIQEAEAKIAELQADKAAAVKAANDAIAEVPAADTITIENYKSAEEKVKAAEEAVAAARAKGATDADFTNLIRIEEAKTKIAALLKALSEAITAANTALAAIPAADSITIQNYKLAEEKIVAAEAAVSDARAKGAVDADFKGLDKIEAAKTKIAALLKVLADAIAAANTALGAIPAADTITIQNYKDAEEKIKAAEEAVSAARTAGAVDADFTGLNMIAEAKAHIAELIKELTEAISAANTALSAIPEADSITIQNYKSAEEKIAAAEAAVADARTKGAVDANFKGLDKIEAAKTKIAALLKALADAITAANTALAAIPEPANITFENYKDTETKISAAEAAVKAAKTKGATDADFTGLTRIDAAKAKVEALLKERADTIAAANTALAEVPTADSITFENYKEAEAKIFSAETAVAEARAKGATDADFTCLTKLSESKAKVEALKKELADAIAAENTALAAIPAADTITIQKYKAAEEKIASAEAAVEAAKAKGATDTDFTGLNRIEAAKTKIAALLKALSDAVTAANQAIQTLPDPSQITAVNINDAITKVDAAKKAVEAAKAKGAADADFVDLDKIAAVEAKIKEFGDLKAAAIQAANEAIAIVPEADSITAETVMEARLKVQRAQLLVAEARAKGAVDSDFAGLEKLAAVVEKLKEFEDDFDLPVYPDPLVSLKNINENIDSFTEEQFSNVINHHYVWSKFEEYREALKELKAQKGKDLTLADIEQIILELNMQFETETLEKINQDPLTLTEGDLEIIAPWILDSKLNLELSIIANELAEQKTQKGSITYSDISEVIRELRNEKALAQLQTEQINVTDEAIVYIIATYNLPYYSFLDVLYREKMQQHIDGNGTLSADVLVQIINQVNDAARNNTFTTMKTNPGALVNEDFFFFNVNYDYALIKNYREALVEKKSQINGDLTLDIVQQVIQQVNREAYLSDLNSGGEIYRNLRYLLGEQFEFTLFAEYTDAIKSELAKGPLTYEVVVQLVHNVNEAKNQQALDYINNNPQAVTISDLLALRELAHYQLYPDTIQHYRDALEADIMKNGPLNNAAEVVQIILKVNKDRTLAILNVNPASVTIQEVGQLLHTSAYELLWTRYIDALKAEIEANRPITIESLNEIFNRVNGEASDEYLELIIQNPDNLTREIAEIALPNVSINDNLIKKYQQAIKELKLNTTDPLTRSDIEQLIEDVNRADREEKNQAVLALLNNDPYSLTWEKLVQMSIYMIPELFEKYKVRIIEHHERDSELTFEVVMGIVQEVHISTALAKLNSNPDTLEISDLQMISGNAREEYLEEYITAIKNAGHQLSLEEAQLMISEVNNAMFLEKVSNDPETLTHYELGTLLGWDIVYEQNLSGYIEEIKQRLAGGGSLTVASLRELVMKVNNNMVEDALKEINANPETFTFETLQKALRHIYLKEEWLEYYRDAVKAERTNGDLSVEILEMVIEQVNQEIRELERQSALEFILNNPDTFTTEDLDRADFDWVYHQYGEYLDLFRDAIKAKVEKDGTNISWEEVMGLMNKVAQDIRDLQEEELLEQINNDLGKLTYETLQNVFSDAREAYFNKYIEAFGKLRETGLITYQQVYDSIRSLNKKESLIEINAGKITHQTLADALTNEDQGIVHFEYVPYYQIAIKNELQMNGSLTVGKLIEIIIAINEEKGLAYLVDNINTFNTYDVSKIIGWDGLKDENLELYRTAIVSLLSSNVPLTAEKLREIVHTVNQNSLLVVIQQNPANVNIYDLQELFNDQEWKFVRYEAEERYRQAIVTFVAALPEGQLLTLENIKDIITAVNEEIDREKLDVINKNLTGFEMYDLSDLFWYFGIEMELWADIQFYRDAVQELHVQLNRDLTLDEIIEAIENGNAAAEQALLDAINKNIGGFDYEHLYNLDYRFNLNMHLWADIAFYRTAVQEMYNQLKRELTPEEIAEAIVKGNTAAEQAKLDVINKNLTGFDYYDLSNVFWEFGLDQNLLWADFTFYQTAIQEMHAQLKRDLTIDEIVEAVKDGNTAAEQALLDAVNKNAAGFDYDALYDLFDRYNIYPDLWAEINFYQMAVQEMQAQLKRELTFDEIVEAIDRAHEAAKQSYLDAINGNIEGFDFNDLYNLFYGFELDDNLLWADFASYKIAIQEAYNLKQSDLTIDEILKAVENANSDAEMEELKIINDNLSGFDFYDLYSVVYDTAPLVEEYFEFYHTAIVQMHDQLKRDLTREEIVEAVTKGNEDAEKYYLNLVNTDPGSLTEYEFQAFLGNDVRFSGYHSEIYYTELQQQKDSFGRDLTKEEIIALVKEINERLLSELVDAVNNRPETLTGEQLRSLLIQYPRVWITTDIMRAFQIKVINHLENGGEPFTLENIYYSLRELEYSSPNLYAFVIPQSEYHVGDQITVEIPSNYYGYMHVYLIPKSSGQITTMDDLQSLVDNGQGIAVLNQDGGDVYLDTSGLQGGEYVAYVADSYGNISLPSNSFLLEGSAQQPQDPEQPEDPTQPEKPPGATIATMDIPYTSGQEVEVSVTDVDQNLDAEAVDTIEVSVESQFGDITITLFETGVDSGVFTGKFTFGDNIDDENDIIYVEPNQNAIISYIDNEDQDNPVFKEITYQP